LSGRHTVRALAVAVVLAGVASGCTEESAAPEPLPSASASSPSASSSAVASPSASETPPAMPAKASGTSSAAAEAFVRHWIAVLNYSGPHGTSHDLRRLSSPRCLDCDAIADAIDLVAKQGGRISGRGWTEIAIKSQHRDQAGHLVVDALVLVNPQMVVTEPGTRPRHFPGGRRLKIFSLAHSASAWQVRDLDQSSG
jgi:hypothetical protein